MVSVAIAQTSPKLWRSSSGEGEFLEVQRVSSARSQHQKLPFSKPPTSSHQQGRFPIPRAEWRLLVQPDVLCGDRERPNLGRKPPESYRLEFRTPSGVGKSTMSEPADRKRCVIGIFFSSRQSGSRGALQARCRYQANLTSTRSVTSVIASRSNEAYGTSSSDSLRPSRKAKTSSHSTCMETIIGPRSMPHRLGQSIA